MENRRECTDVIRTMLLLIPATETELIKDLNWNLDDASYKAPEQNIQWMRTHETLGEHISVTPTEEWEFAVLSVFSTKSVEELKKLVNEG